MKNSRLVIWIYITTSLIMLCGSALALLRNWENTARVSETKLHHDANVLCALVDSSVTDAIKMLEIAKSRFDELGGNLPDSNKHQLLNSVVEDFSLLQNRNLFGLMFFVDASGQIKAQNSDGILANTNVSDRRYFIELQKNPHQKFSLGNLVKGRVSGDWVFHVAVPILNKSGAFSGILLQQIRAVDLAEVMKVGLVDEEETLKVFLPDGRVQFSSPVLAVSDDASQRLSNQAILEELSQPIEVQPIKALAHFNEKYFISYKHSALFGTVTVASVPVGAVLKAFIADQTYLLLYVLSAGILITVLFYLLYKRSISFEVEQQRSIHDPLTGLYNRRALDEKLCSFLRLALREKEPISILFIDIDHFKSINDIYGHEVGDQVLQHLAKALAHTLRRPLDFICRWGGEEFVAVLPNTGRAGAMRVANEILNAVRQMPTVSSALPCGITVSIGVSSKIPDSENIHDDLIDQADKAMLLAKRQGRDRLVCYEETI